MLSHASVLEQRRYQANFYEAQRLWVVVLVAVFVTLLGQHKASAQASFPSEESVPEDEWQLWTSTILKTDLNKRTSIQLRNIIRFDDDMTRFARFAPEPRMSYDVTDWLKLYLGYRFSYDPKKKGGADLQHRVFGGFQTMYEIQKVELSYRLVFQEDLYEDENDNGEEMWTNDNVLRQRLGIEYKLSKWIHPYLQYEHFYDLQSASGDGPKEWRYTFGNQMKINKHHNASLYIRQDTPFDDSKKIVRMLGLKYTYEF